MNLARERYVATLQSVPDAINMPNGFQIRKLLVEAISIKNRIGRKPKPDEHDEGSGLLAELDSVTRQLVELGGGQSLRHGQLAFIQRRVAGRETMDWNMFVAELRNAGVDEDLIQECRVKSRKQGAGYMSHEYVDLNIEKGD